MHLWLALVGLSDETRRENRKEEKRKGIAQEKVSGRVEAEREKSRVLLH